MNYNTTTHVQRHYKSPTGAINHLTGAINHLTGAINHLTGAISHLTGAISHAKMEDSPCSREP